MSNGKQIAGAQAFVNDIGIAVCDRTRQEPDLVFAIYRGHTRDGFPFQLFNTLTEHSVIFSLAVLNPLSKPYTPAYTSTYGWPELSDVQSCLPFGRLVFLPLSLEEPPLPL